MNIISNCTSHTKRMYIVFMSYQIQEYQNHYNYASIIFSTAILAALLKPCLFERGQNINFKTINSAQKHISETTKINCCQVRKLQLNKRSPRCQIWLTSVPKESLNKKIA